MRQPKQLKVRKRESRAEKNRPLESDELIALETARAQSATSTQIVPPPIKRPLIISALDEPQAKIALKPSREFPNAYVADSTSRLVVGALGRSGERLPRSAAPKKVQLSTPPKRPRHRNYSYVPRIAPRKSRPLLRSPNGHLIEADGVYGKDDRVNFLPNEYPWFCAGKLFSWTDPANGFSLKTGSAALVGRRLVLTAGHLCPWNSNPWQMLFSPGHLDTKSIVGIDSYVSDYRGWDTGSEVEGYDVALLRLYDPLGDELGWFGSLTYQNSWQNAAMWSLIGWPLTPGGTERPTYQDGISVLRSDASKYNFVELMHRGDSSEGNSGGPFFTWLGDGFPYVAGTQSGQDLTENKDFNAAAGGRALVDLIRWGLENWP